MKTRQKLDLYKLHRQDYVPSAKPALIKIPTATYLTIIGKGEPGGGAFSDKIGALYGVAFTVKMARKFSGRRDYAVCKLEAQWWAKDNSPEFFHQPKAQWQWKLLIRTPDFVRESEVRDAVAVLLKRGKTPTVREVQLESLTEGLCVQMLHVGPYEREGETLRAMAAHAATNSLAFDGRHHEIYLSDPRRVPPERLKTILRHPVSKR
jgi:hypothetical protein